MGEDSRPVGEVIPRKVQEIQTTLRETIELMNGAGRCWEQDVVILEAMEHLLTSRLPHLIAATPPSGSFTPCLGD